jgi:fatty-acid desaturase
MSAITSEPFNEETAIHPWQRSFFWYSKGEGWVLFWVLLIHVTAAIGLVLFPIPDLKIFLAAAVLAALGGFGTTVGYHRALAHKSVKLHPVVEFILVAVAIWNGSGTPATWSANHRLHHAKVETPEDISSPRIGGFMWSHLRWLWQVPQTSVERWAPDLDRPMYRFLTRFQVPILAVSYLLPLVFGFQAFFWLGAIRICYSLHAQCFVNSIAHLKEGVKDGEDSSQNLVWLGFMQLFQGENWHGNHHANPSSARLGWTWKQIDMGWWLIVSLEKLGLATEVRRPRHTGL